MPMRFFLLAAAFLACASPLRAQQEDTTQPPELMPPEAKIPTETRAAPTEEETPPFLRWMLHPRRRGLLINLPIIDTDPNRGTTYGVMPVMVIQGKKEDRIVQIHAPSVTYNREFGINGTYRYYYYPSKDAALSLRGAIATNAEKEAFAHYEDRTLFGSDLYVSLRGQFNVDGANRFFGFGPASALSAQSDYTEDVIQYEATVGVPLAEGSPWMVYAKNRMAGEKIYGGKINSLPDLSTTFPGVAPVHRRQVDESRVMIGYDSRDDAVTTTHGVYFRTYAGASNDDMASAYDYTRYGMDVRYFYPWPQNPNFVTAAHFNYDQLLGNAPFWLLSSIGGKYSLRAYGDNRYVDRGSMLYDMEQRCTVFKAKMAGVTTEFEVDPFAGLGTVFDNPERLARRYVRPVVGTAFRAVARPQVVGSIDVGVGQEGLAVFMDINYSF